MHPSRLRSLAKALTWRALGTLDTFLLGLLITGRADFAAGIASTEVLTKTALYYLHERGWSAVRWGSVPDPAPAYARRFAVSGADPLDPRCG